MRTLLTFLLIINSITGMSQQRISGSYLIVAVCKDGIIMGADTRLCFYNLKDTLAYMDTIPKIFITENFGIGITKYGVVQGKTMFYYINEFNKEKYKLEKSLDGIPSFFSFIKNKFPQSYNEFTKLNIASAGYINDTPFLCGYMASKRRFDCGNNGILSSAKEDSIDFNGHYSCKQMAK